MTMMLRLITGHLPAVTMKDDDEVQAHASAVDCLSVTVQVDYLPVRAAKANIVELTALRYRQCLSWLQ